MIFDRFPSKEKAEQFAADVSAAFGRQATVHDSQRDAETRDVFPWQLDPPIVMVDRDDGTDDPISEMVESYGGTFAGT